MKYHLSPDDRHFIAALEAGSIEPIEFDHRAHVRAAYIYLAQTDADQAALRMRDTLLAYLRSRGVDTSKYHETITKAWILAVRHFMALTPTAESANAFIAANPQLLDAKIMLSHYSAELLFSSEARAAFIEPDLGPIPRHE
jgi:hypothetical protein